MHSGNAFPSFIIFVVLNFHKYYLILICVSTDIERGQYTNMHTNYPHGRSPADKRPAQHIALQ